MPSRKTKIGRTKIFPNEIFYGWNPIVGFCPYECWYCWSNRQKRRFHREPKELGLDFKKWNTDFPKEPSKILVCWTTDLFHPVVKHNQIESVIDRTVVDGSKHTFLFLTKNPDRYREFTFPENC